MKWHRIPIWPLLLGILAGILSYQAIPKIYWSPISVVLALLLIAALFFCAILPKSISGSRQVLRNISVLLTMVMVGYFNAYYSDIWNASNYFGNHIDSASHFVVKTQDHPIAKNKTYLLPVTVQASVVGNKLIPATGNLQLYIYKSDEVTTLRKDQLLTIPNTLVPISNSNNPFSFNYKAYAAHQQLHYQAFYNINALIKTDTSSSAPSLIAKQRARVIESISSNVKDSTTASLMLAMLLNERTMLHKDIWEAYSTTGIVHVISISGMHVQIFLSILLALLFWIKNKKYKGLKYLLANVVVWYYIILTEHPASAVRAGLMFSITTFALLLEKEENPINSLGVAGFIMLLINPNWLYNLGMQLSFLCMLSIFIFYKPIYRLLSFEKIWLQHLWQGIALSIAVQVLVAPIAVYYFQQFPIFVLLVNIPAALYAYLLMVGGLVIAALAPLVSVVWLGEILTGVTAVFHKIVFFFAQHTPSFLSQFGLDAVDTLLLLSTTTLLTYGLLVYKSRHLAIIGGAIGMIFCVSILIQKWQANTQERLVVYQVANATCVQAIKGKQSYLYRQNIEENNVKHLLLPPQLHWNLNKKHLPLPANAVFKLKNNKVILLNAATTNSAPVDILILSAEAPFQPEVWSSGFGAKMLVLDSSFPRWKAQKWVKDLNNLNFAVYSVTLQGALVLPDIR